MSEFTWSWMSGLHIVASLICGFAWGWVASGKNRPWWEREMDRRRKKMIHWEPLPEDPPARLKHPDSG